MITKQPVLNIGLVGHIDHGKTTLLQRLSGVWADKHSEEIKRGITIKLGYADVVIKKCEKCNFYTIEDKCSKCGGKTKEIKYVSFIDAPGHEMLMATMLGGAAIIDAALLIIAANEPFPQPQTKEHFLALQAKGVENVIIVQNKIDLISKEEALKQHKEIKDFFKGTFLEKSLIIPVCAQQNLNIDKILEEIDKIKLPERDLKSKPLFLIARSFDINKPGTKPSQLRGSVLGGTLKKGVLKVGDIIEIKPGQSFKKKDVITYKTIKTKILALKSGKNSLQEVIPSGSLGIETSLDPGLGKTDSLSGCVAGLDNNLPEITTSIKMKVNLFKEIVGSKSRESLEVEPIKINEPLMLSINTTITVGFVKKISKEEIELNLKIPVVPFKGSRIGIARNYKGHWRLIGWGELT